MIKCRLSALSFFAGSIMNGDTQIGRLETEHCLAQIWDAKHC